MSKKTVYKEEEKFMLKVFKLYSFLVFCIKGAIDIFTFCSFLLTGMIFFLFDLI